MPGLKPKAGEVLIKIEAIGHNYADATRRHGDSYPVPTPLPFTLSVEITGVIAGLGEGISVFEIGSPVFAIPGEDRYAE